MKSKFELDGTALLYNATPKTESGPPKQKPNKEAYSWMLQLQSGYTQLNGYRNRLNQVPPNKCDCGQTETVEHFLLQCPWYESARNTMELNLSRSTGLYHLDLQILLGIEDDDNIPNFRESIIQEQTQYIRATGRFQHSPIAPKNP